MNSYEKKIKLKAVVKQKCNCKDHCLELLQSFDGKECIYKRYCYKCGKWWTDTEHIYETIVVDTSGRSFTLYESTRIIVPKVIRAENTITFDDGNGRRDIYELDKCGCIGKLIKIERYKK